MPPLRPPNCRSAETFDFECNGLRHTAAISRSVNSALAEIFPGNSKGGACGDSTAKDLAVVCSIALQFGVPTEELLGDSKGPASSPLGVARDILAEVDRKAAGTVR